MCRRIQYSFNNPRRFFSFNHLRKLEVKTSQLHKDIRRYIFHGPSGKQCERSVPVRQLDRTYFAGVEGHFTFPPRFSTSFRHNTPAQLNHYYYTVTTLRAEGLWNSGKIPSTGKRTSSALAKLRKATITFVMSGARGGVAFEALRYKPEGRGFDSRWCHWIFLIDVDIILPVALWPWG
jgi:hypothetical protein